MSRWRPREQLREQGHAVSSEDLCAEVALKPISPARQGLRCVLAQGKTLPTCIFTRSSQGTSH